MIDFNNDSKLLTVFGRMINNAKMEITTGEPVVRAIFRIRQDALAEVLVELMHLVGKNVLSHELKDQAMAAAKEELNTKISY